LPVLARDQWLSILVLTTHHEAGSGSLDGRQAKARLMAAGATDVMTPSEGAT